MTDSVFVVSMVVMATVVFALRAAGLVLGNWLSAKTELQRFLAFLPACAIGAAIGPQLATASLMEHVSVGTAIVLFAISGRLFFSFVMATLVLFIAQW